MFLLFVRQRLCKLNLVLFVPIKSLTYSDYKSRVSDMINMRKFTWQTILHKYMNAVRYYCADNGVPHECCEILLC